MILLNIELYNVGEVYIYKIILPGLSQPEIS